MGTTKPIRLRVATESQLMETIAARRRALGLSQRDVAEKLGIAQSYLSLMESGRRATTMDRLLPLLNILGLEIIVQRTANAVTGQE